MIRESADPTAKPKASEYWNCVTTGAAWPYKGIYSRCCLERDWNMHAGGWGSCPRESLGRRNAV